PVRLLRPAGGLDRAGPVVEGGRRRRVLRGPRLLGAAPVCQPGAVLRHGAAAELQAGVLPAGDRVHRHLPADLVRRLIRAAGQPEFHASFAVLLPRPPGSPRAMRRPLARAAAPGPGRPAGDPVALLALRGPPGPRQARAGNRVAAGRETALAPCA